MHFSFVVACHNLVAVVVLPFLAYYALIAILKNHLQSI
jgi:hypothetical protein